MLLMCKADHVIRFCLEIYLIRLNRMLYAPYLSYHSQHRSCLACLSSGWANTTGRLLGPKVGNSIKGLSQRYSHALPHRESNQVFATFRLLARRSTEPRRRL